MAVDMVWYGAVRCGVVCWCVCVPTYTTRAVVWRRVQRGRDLASKCTRGNVLRSPRRRQRHVSRAVKSLRSDTSTKREGLED